MTNFSFCITINSGSDITRLQVQFPLKDDICIELNLDPFPAQSPVNNVSQEKPLKNGETIEIRLENIARDEIRDRKNHLDSVTLLGIKPEIIERGICVYGSVTADEWKNSMTIGKIAKITVEHGCAFFDCKATPTVSNE